MNKKTIKDIDLAGKKVIVRVDFNIPQDENRNITDDKRIRAALPTIEYLIEKKCKIILMSHMGRPKGQVNEKYSLNIAAARLGELIGKDVKMADDCVGDNVEKMVSELAEGDVMLLENLRFYPEEEKNDPEFAKKLANLAEIYVNDAFGTAHRAHASTEGISKYIPSVAGFLLGKEVDYLSKAVSNPERPFVAIIGGAKVSDKIKVIENLIAKVDTILIGGAMAYTFLKEKGVEVGKSLVQGVIEDKKGRKIDCPALARNAMKLAEEKGVNLLLPVDHIQAKPKKEIDAKGKEKISWCDASADSVENIEPDFCGVDIGKQTQDIYARETQNAKMVVWNGPMGIFEVKPFDAGTLAVAKACVTCTENGGTSIIGGGDSVAAIEQLGLSDKISHISTGGGASLELLEGKILPGVAALND